MIRAIRACKTASEERAIVRKECTSIRAAISENDQDYRHRDLAKLMFIHMLGYPTHFGQMECLKLIASPGFPEKRIGYLGLKLLLDERQEVLMLVANSIKQDLNHTNQYIVGLALCVLGNICSAEMARDLSPEAALCTIRIIKKVPDLAENFINPAAALLKEKHHGVLLTGVQFCTDMCKVSTDALEYFRKKCIDGLVKVLRDVEYDFSGITDPFIHIRLLKLLHVLGQGDADASDTMNDILAQVVTRTESNKNAGKAILYERVATIMSIEDNGGLRVLAINILGRFLSSHDNNIRYVALNMLMKAISLDSRAVQRHRATILECVKDSDASIRKRALELVYLLVNESNFKSLTKELADYLKVSDPDFKGELTAKIGSVVEKFSPEKQWYIDQMVKVLSEAANFVKDEVWHALIIVITNAPNIHGYAVRALYKAVHRAGEQKTLVRVAVWCIGEYGEILVTDASVLDVEDPITKREGSDIHQHNLVDHLALSRMDIASERMQLIVNNVTEADAVDVVETAIRRHSSDLTTRAMCLIALLKVSGRYPSFKKMINDFILHQKGSVVLELQQRAIEFNAIIEKHEKIRSALVERMSVPDEATYSGRRAGSMPAAVSTSQGSLPKMPNGVVKPTSGAPFVDLLDLSSDETAAPSSSGGYFLQDLLGVDLSPTSQGTNQTSKSGTDVLLDLLSIGTLTAQSTSSMLDVMSFGQDNKNSGGMSNKLASPSASSAPSSSLVASSSMLDLLNGFGPGPSVPETNGQSYPSVVAYENNLLKVTFYFSKEPGNPQTTLIEAQFVNKSPDIYSNFVFQAADPKFIQLHLDTASSNTLPANGNGLITQKLRITNSQHGQKSLVMRIRAATRQMTKMS